MTTPVWMVRINPMARRRLADRELDRLLDQRARGEANGGLAQAASDDLHDLVPGTPESLRRRLLGLRRDIHNDRVPRAPRPAIELPASVDLWLENRQRRVADDARIRAAYRDAVDRERSTLRDWLGEGNFQTTLAQSAPGVYDAAVRYRSRRPVDSRDRKAERALLQYLTRAMVRTSPYGRFTAVGLAAPDPSGVALDEVTPATARPHVGVDRAMFDYVMGGLAPATADPLVTLPPTARVSDDAVTFFHAGGDGVRRLSAPMRGPTHALVESLGLGPRRRSALTSALAARLGVEPPVAERLTAMALEVGLLVTAWRGDEFVGQPADEAAQALDGRAAAETRAVLDQYRRELQRLADAEPTSAGPAAEAGPNTPAGEADLNTPGGEADLISRLAIQRRLEGLGEELGRRARRPAKLTVNEDYILDPLAVDPGRYRPALDDLAAVAALLEAFDRMHVVRALVSATVVARFGPGCQVPLVEHAEALVRAAYQAEGALAEAPDAAVGPTDGSLAMLVKIRQEALVALQHGLDGPDDVRWSPADVLDLVANIPDRFRLDPASYGMVVQPHGGQLVFNDSYAGHGPMVSRFLHADQVRGGDASARLRERLRRLYGPDVRLLEDGGTHSLSINAHPPVLDQRLDPEGWQRLRLAHDPETDTVSIVDGDGTPAKVLFLGAQLPELVPYPVRLATWLCSSGRVPFDVTPGRPRGDRYARLRVGGVVLSRRRWYPGPDFPAAADCHDEVDYLLALARWRGRHGAPPEVMLKTVFDVPTRWDSLASLEARDTFFALRRHSKPQYVDLGSALMTRVLPRFLERRPEGCIEEALPGLAEGGHAIEWMIELTRPAGRAEFGWEPEMVDRR